MRFPATSTYPTSTTPTTSPAAAKKIFIRIGILIEGPAGEGSSDRIGKVHEPGQADLYLGNLFLTI
jgi:hypothetical protein